jgi:hypothetical protein
MKPFLLASLFFLLSPGVILTLPKGSKGYFFSGQTSVTAAIVHALVFIVVYTVLRYVSKDEGFGCGCQQESQPACECMPSCEVPKPTCNIPKPTCNTSKSKSKSKPKCREQTMFEWLFGESGKIPYRI